MGERKTFKKKARPKIQLVQVSVGQLKEYGKQNVEQQKTYQQINPQQTTTKQQQI